MSHKIEIPSTAAVVVNNSSATSVKWKGLGIDDLKMRRANGLIKRELGRLNLSQQYQNTREKVSQNGVRGLLFNTGEITKLKKTDYAYLGYKAIRLIVKLYLKHKRK